MILKEFELFRLMPSSKIAVDTISSGGGSLVTGAYQFAYRLIDDYSGRSTKFSLFTHPVSISVSDSSGDKSGSINATTEKAIEISFSATNQEVAMYSTYQIAIIESTSGNGQSNLASLSENIALTPGKNSYKYDSNSPYDRVGLENISIDDAAILTFKTIAFKNNKLVGGNIKYKDLSFDNGSPVVSSGSIITRKIPVSGNTDKATSESRGYFLDEVYRFYVSHWDEFGNFSFPYPLNMSNVVGNESSSFNGFKDMRFPKRSVDVQIIETINPGGLDEHLLTINRGLNLTIGNIPSWSKGYVVLRAKRKKGVLFQSPIIPTMVIQSPDAQGEYPGENVGAPNPLGTIAPKNMGLQLNKSIVRTVEGEFSSVDWKANYTGSEFCKKIHVAYPPEIIFNNSGVPYVDFIKNEKINLESVDYCFLSQGAGALLSRNEALTSADPQYGNDGSRSTSLTISASRSGDYASSRLNAADYKAEIELTGRGMTDEVSGMSVVPAGISVLPITGIHENTPTSDFGNYGSLEIVPDGNYNGTPASNLRSIVFTTKFERSDISYFGVDGVKSGYGTQSILKGRDATGALVGIAAADIRNEAGESSNPGYESIKSFLEIVNFKTSLGDNRYGEPGSYNDIVSTGSIASYDSAPASSSIEVFGGDCYISPFTFKVHDTGYAVVNSGRWGDTGKGWGTSFKDSLTREVKRNFPYKSESVNIGLYLESEVNSLYGEDFYVKGRDGIYNKIVPVVSNWGGSAVRGAFYLYQNRIYRALINDSGPKNPVDSVGYIYEDLGLNLHGSYYDIKYPIDLFYFSKSLTENKSGLNYLYNPEFSIEDQSKPFPVIFSKDRVNRTNFSARLVYSDTGVIQTNIDGLNRFRVGNFYDLEESKGALTKLRDHKGNLYGIQQGAFCYIPFEASVVETADGISLAVQSSRIIGIPQYIENHGTDYIRTVVSTPMGLMFGDFDNSKIVRFEGGTTYLNDLGVASYVRSVSASLRGLETSDKDAQFYYDYSLDDTVFKIKQEALVLGPNNVFKTIIKPNVSNNTTRWDYGMYNNSEHYMLGRAGNDFVLTRVNDESAIEKKMLGQVFGSKISFAVNSDGYHTKMFYLVKFLANKPDLASIVSYSNNTAMSSYSSVTMQDRWAGFLLNKVRDSSTLRRVRGEYAIVTTSVEYNEIATALTKVQSAHRII